MDDHGRHLCRPSLSRPQDQRAKNYPKGSMSCNSVKREEDLRLSRNHVNGQDDVKNEDYERPSYHVYCGKYRKSAVRTNPSTGHNNLVLGIGNYDDKPMKMLALGGMIERDEHKVKMEKKLSLVKYKEKRYERNKNYNVGCYDKLGGALDNVDDEIETKWSLLEEFRKMYRKLESRNVRGRSVRIDQLAWKMLKESGKVLEPVKTIGPVSGVEIEDCFGLRLELVIMGIHFEHMNGIDYMDMYPNGRLLATSVVATEGYSDNMISPDVLEYTGEGGNFGTERRGKKVKDQVLEGGNLALKNSLIEGNEVRVVRGIKRGRMGMAIFVYDGLYKVVDFKKITGSCGNTQFQFKLARCSGQKHIVWAKYK